MVFKWKDSQTQTNPKGVIYCEYSHLLQCWITITSNPKNPNSLPKEDLSTKIKKGVIKNIHKLPLPQPPMSQFFQETQEFLYDQYFLVTKKLAQIRMEDTKKKRKSREK